jgi:hypothetical protein
MVDMTSRASSSRMNPELDDFLFAPIREERNGMVLSVISGLTRLDIDPWTEAARLSALPKAIAAQTLAPIIARLAEGGAELFDAREIADRLIKLLPSCVSPVSTEPADRGGRNFRHFRLAIVLICLLLGTVAFLAATTRRDPPSDNDAPAPRQSIAVSPPLSRD